MSRVDLERNRSALLQAHAEVSNPKNDTNWALFGYEGQTNVLKLVSKGDGGIEEMVDDLSSGKIMYAYCRVHDPNTNLPKLVIINWQGEGVPEMKKGSCSNHIKDISSFLKGAHVTIYARTEEDVDVDDILKKVAKSSGANYSFHKEKPNPEMNAPAGPVGTAYERIRPDKEIKPNIRDKFWKQQQEEEKKRREELERKNREEKERAERERKEREMIEAQERDAKEQERIKKIMERKRAEKQAEEAKEAEMKKKWEETQVEAMRDEEERRKRADRLRKERANEAQSLVSQRSANPRQAFEQKTSQFDEPAKQAPPPRKIKHGFLDEPKSQFDEPQEKVDEQAVSKPAARPPSPPASIPVSHSPARNLFAEGLPKRQDSDEDQEEQDWNEPEAEITRQDQEVPETMYQDVSEPAVDTEPSQSLYDDVQQHAESNQTVYAGVDEPEETGQDIYDDVKPNIGGGGGGGDQMQFPPEQGLVARALYDYQACEDNEVSFDPGDLITNIDRIDPGWWIGVTPDGSQGMFPSNYVELLNG